MKHKVPPAGTKQDRPVGGCRVCLKGKLGTLASGTASITFCPQLAGYNILADQKAVQRVVKVTESNWVQSSALSTGG